jgi:hypothetical protein
MVPVDPEHAPAYSDRAQWAARQQKVRDALPDQLGAIIGMSRNKP